MHSMGAGVRHAGPQRDGHFWATGAGAVILQPTEKEGQGVLTTHLHSDGTHAEQLAMLNPGSHGGYHLGKENFGYPEVEYGELFIYPELLERKEYLPQHGRGNWCSRMRWFKFPEVIKEALGQNGSASQRHRYAHPAPGPTCASASSCSKSSACATTRFWNNIQKYGNTTAASIPIALCEAWGSRENQRG